MAAGLKLSILALVLSGAPAFCLEHAQGHDIQAAEAGSMTRRFPIMHVTPEWMKSHQARREAMPFHPQASPEKFYAELMRLAGAPSTGNTMGAYLINNMSFASCGGVAGWNQHSCGNCWVWGSTAAMSADYGVASGAPQLFSVQWFDSDYYATGNGTVCNGGDSSEFATWYNSHPKLIPWTNTNAGYADANGPSTPAMSASSISQTPSVNFTGVTVSQIATNGVTSAQAIANIKSVLDSGKAVVLSYFLPAAGWNDFENTFWAGNSETTPWANVDKYNGFTFVQSTDPTKASGGHLVCVVGYDNTNSSWIILNSWGSTSSRPDGYFELPQSMGYNDTFTLSGSTYYQYEFDTYNVSGFPISSPLATTSPANVTVTAGGSASFAVTASGGTSPYKYQWYKNGAAVSGGISASYTFTAAAADNGSTFYAKVTDSAASPATVQSGTATLTVGSVVAPTITTQPVSKSVAAGATASFSVTASGTAPLSYQWYKGTAAISGATAASYTTPATTATDNGTTFHVTVSNAAGTATSSNATLTVTTSNTYNEVESNNTTATANVVADNITKIVGYISSTSDKDYFKMNVQPGKTITVNMTGPSGVDYDLYFLNSSGSTLKSSLGSTATESITYTNTSATATVFYIYVKSYSGSSTATPYNLALIR